MAEVTISGEYLRVEIQGLDKVLALKSTIEVPLSHVHGADVAPSEAKGFHGLRLPGTYLPGVVTAGSFYDGEWLFFDVHDPDRAVKIDLDHEHYAALIVQVADPDSTVRDIRAAVAKPA
jgi:hypothetical protein